MAVIHLPYGRCIDIDQATHVETLGPYKVQANFDAIEGASGDLESGDLLPTAMTAAKVVLRPGFLLCDGRYFTYATYPTLYDAIGLAFNYGGEPAGNFRIPDFRQRVPLAAGSSTGLIARTIGQYGGYENMLTASHYHEVHAATSSAAPATAGATGVYPLINPPATPYAYTNSAGGTDIGTNVSPFVVVSWMIKI